MVDTVIEKYGKIDILVNNAGGYPKEIYNNIEHQAIKIWEWSEEQWIRSSRPIYAFRSFASTKLFRK